MKNFLFIKTASNGKLSYLLLFALFLAPQIMQAQKLDWVSLANVQNSSSTYQPFQLQICTDENNSSYVIGYNRNEANFGQNITSSSNSYFLARYDKNGKIKWVINPKGKGYCYLFRVSANGYNDIALEGVSYTQASFNGVAIDSGVSFIMKTDTNGNVKWLKEYNADSIKLTALSEGSGGITYFSGIFSATNGVHLGATLIKGQLPYNTFIASLDSSGNIQWANILATATTGIENHFTSSIYLDQTGAVYQLNEFVFVQTFDTIIADGKGYFNELSFHGQGHTLYLLSKLHTDGSNDWGKPVNWAGGNTNLTVDAQGDIFSISQTSTDSFFHTNSKNTDSSAGNTYIVKSDSSGSPLGAYNYAADSMNIQSIASDNSGHFYGVFYSYTNGTLYIVNQYNNTGVLKWSDTLINQPYSLIPAVYAVAAGTSDKLMVAGTIDSIRNFTLDTSVKCSSYAIFTAMLDTNSKTDTTKSAISTPLPPASTFSLYPNPATQNISLKYAANSPCEYNCTITDITGREVQSTPIQTIAGENINQINVQNLSAGMYIVTLQGAHFVQRLKFLKE